MQGATLDEARAAKEEAESRLRHLPTVAGIGLMVIGKGYGIKVNLTAPLDGPGADVPSEICGVPVLVSVVGNIRKLEGS
jgi:hypothetical protein